MGKFKVKSIRIRTMDDFTRLMSKNSGFVDPDDDTTKQINALKDQLRTLNAVLDYITNNAGKLRGVLLPSVRSAQSKVQTGIDRIPKQIDALKQLLVKQQNFANRVVLPANDGEFAGNGKCYIQFVNVGMGDCSLITTPSGKTIMIDLGSSSQTDINLDGDLPGTPAEIIRNNITSKYYLNGGGTVDMLLLTHPDEDHYNLIQSILKGYISTINTVYYGGTENFSDYYPQSGFIRELTGTDSSIKRVVLREENGHFLGKVIQTKTLNKKTPGTTGVANTIGKEFIDPGTGEMVLYYEEIDKAIVFKISILASNIIGAWVGNKFVVTDSDIKTAGEMKLNGTPNNVRSLVILVECFGRKILITGDATALTEQVVVNNYAGILAGVDTLRFGHHGSPTSSARAFVNAQNKLTRAVASTGGKNTVLHHLPKKLIIDEYVNKVPATALDHVIYAFSDVSPLAQPIGPLKKNLFATGSNGNVSFVEEKSVSRVFLQNKLILEQPNGNNS